jgi:hypothetical protein
MATAANFPRNKPGPVRGVINSKPSVPSFFSTAMEAEARREPSMTQAMVARVTAAKNRFLPLLMPSIWGRRARAAKAPAATRIQ